MRLAEAYAFRLFTRNYTFNKYCIIMNTTRLLVVRDPESIYCCRTE
jgi:hypothetical protein